MVNRTLEELGKFINEEYGGVIAERGTPYPCNQQQIDLYTLQPYCHQGNHLVMSEHNAISMLEDFLDRSRPPTPSVSAALHRIKDAINIKDDWYPDVVLKAAYDIDTAFFMGRLKGNVRIMWVNRIRMVEQYGSSMAYMLGHTHYLGHGCSSVWLSMQDILLESEFPRTKMWKVVFHELIHAFCLAVCHNPHLTAYDHAQGWSSGHGYLFRRCLRAIQNRTKTYFEGLCIATAEDITDFNAPL